jgi:hypothetical protein
MAVTRLINQGRIAEAEAVLSRTAPSAAQRLFFQGQVLKAQGRLPEAIATFRAVLRLKPDSLNARRELAHSQMLNRDFKPARDQFTALLDIDPDPQMRDGYRRFLSTIDQNRPLTVQTQFAVLPSSNARRGTTNTVFDTAIGQMGWLPPSPNGIVMCQDVGLRTTKRRGRRDERYNDRGGSGKKCFPDSRGIDDGRGQVSQEADAPAVHGVHGRTPGLGGCFGSMRQCQLLGA